MRAALPANEPERLAALLTYGLLDTPPEDRVDRLSREACRIFGVPFGLVTLFDSSRQYFKSRIGTDISEAPVDQAFCAHMILEDQELVVCDALTDERFADNPFVSSGPKIRFYAGVPLITPDGFRIGSLCVLDVAPKPTPDPVQMEQLRDMAAQIMDLFEADRVRKRVRRTEQAAALSLEASGMGSWEWDRTLGIADGSDHFFQIMGFDQARPIPPFREFLRRVHVQDRPGLLAGLQAARTAAEKFRLRFRVVDPKGVERSITTVGNHLFDDRGVLVGAVGVVWDSTAQDRSRAESEELLRGLNVACPVGIFVTDLEGHLTYSNQRLADTFALSHEDLRLRKWIDRIHPDDASEFAAVLSEAIEKRKPFELECRLLLPDQSQRWILARSAIMNDKAGDPVGILGTVDDITDRKRSLDDLREAKNAAEIASRSKDLFLANVSHELRTPLNGVLGMTDLLLDTDLAPEQREMAQIARDSGRSLLVVVNDILDLSRIEAGKLDVEKAPFDLLNVLGQSMTLMEREARAKGLALELKQPSESVFSFWGDGGRIKQILLVYLTNALKFTSQGGVTVEVVVDPLSADAAELLLTVRDTGPGIPLEAQAKLFRPFSQADASSTRKHGGVGLGLAIARKLANLMGGTVGVMSFPGEGATFWLRITLQTYCVETKQQKQKFDAEPVVCGGRILVVEDNVINQKVVMRVLQKLGWQTDLAPNGLVAVDLVRQNDYTAVLMDCQMPELDGYAATEEIRAWERSSQRSEVPIIALTAHAMTGDRERCLRAGMNDYLAKPFGLNELRITLNRWGQLSSASKQLTA